MYGVDRGRQDALARHLAFSGSLRWTHVDPTILRKSEAPPVNDLAPRCLVTLAAFWPHNDAQRCRLLRTSEQHFSRSTEEWAGSRHA